MAQPLDVGDDLVEGRCIGTLQAGRPEVGVVGE